MDQLNKNRFLNIVIIILLIANLTTFGIFWSRQTQTKHEEQRQFPKELYNKGALDFLSRELNFTDVQRNQFEQLKNEHRKLQEPIRSKIEKAKFDFFGLVKKDSISNTMINEAWDKVALTEKEIDVNTLNHFRLVRKICDSMQMIKFDSIIQKAIIQFRPNPKERPSQDQMRKDGMPQERKRQPQHRDGEFGPPEGGEFGPPPPRRPNGPLDGRGRPPHRPGDSSRRGERPPPPEN